MTIWPPQQCCAVATTVSMPIHSCHLRSHISTLLCHANGILSKANPLLALSLARPQIPMQCGIKPNPSLPPSLPRPLSVCLFIFPCLRSGLIHLL